MPIIADVSATSGPTLDELVTEIVSTVQGGSVAPDKLVTLVGDITPTDSTFRIDGTASPGVFEIDDELVYVIRVDDNTGTCVVHPRGRGWQGSTATDHLDGDVVVDGPSLSRHRTAQLINDTISTLHPLVFGVGTTTVEVAEATPLVEVPDDAEFVLDVRRSDDGDWTRIRHWESENSSDVAGSTGRAVRLPACRAGDTVQIVFGTRPQPLTSGEMTWSETGLGLGMKDAIVTGVLSRVARTLDMGRLTDRFVTPQGDSQQPQLGAGFAMARQLQADFTAAVDREAAALRKLYPARVHFVR